MPERNITFEIKEHLGVIGKRDSNWTRELNVISWNGAAPKYDIRDWDEHHEKMSRGITLSQWEMRKMVDLYVSRNNERAVARGRAIQAERNARRDAAFRNREFTEGTETLSAAETADAEEQGMFTAAMGAVSSDEEVPFDPETGEVLEDEREEQVAEQESAPVESTESEEDSF